jgi:aminoglycoside 3-N-acetyltransferase
MSEHDTIRSSDQPSTVESLIADLRALGLRSGMTVMVHSSLSKLGWVCGGPVTVILALQRVLTSSGTLVMPTHSGDLSDPAYWQNPPVPEAWWETIRATMPAYDPDLTPTRGMGVICETFRKGRDVRRSAHPALSFAAWGAHAELVTAQHELAVPLGDGSPLARLYDLDAWVLLLGVGHANNTSLHLAEYRAGWPGKRIMPQGAPILVNGSVQWVAYDDVNTDSDDFAALGEDFNAEFHPRRGKVGQGEALFFPQRAAVDYAVRWLPAHRTP